MVIAIIEKLTSERKGLKNKLQKLKKQKEELEKRISENQLQKDKENELKLLREEVEKCKKDVKIQESKIKTMNNDLKLLMKKDSCLKSAISRLMNEKSELFLHCKVVLLLIY